MTSSATTHEVVVIDFPETEIPPLRKGGSERDAVHLFAPVQGQFFLGSEISINDEAARSLLLTDVRVGKYSQLWNSEPIPAEAFSDRMKEPLRFFLDTAHTGQGIELRFVNMTAEPVRVRAQMKMPLVDGKPLGHAEPERSFPIGFNTYFGAGNDDSIEPGKTRTITTRPQTIYRPTGLFIPESIGKDFELIDITVMGNSQMAPHHNPVAASIFSKGTGLPLKTRRIQIAEDLALVVRNTSSTPKYFRALMTGGSIRTRIDTVSDYVDENNEFPSDT